jgi:hypothetical protein
MSSQLPHSIVSRVRVLGADLENFIRETYNRPDYDLCASEESQTLEEYGVCNDQPLSEYYRQEVDSFASGIHSGAWLLRTLLQDMCYRNLIPSGIYLVEVDYG